MYEITSATKKPCANVQWNETRLSPASGHGEPKVSLHNKGASQA